MPARLADDLAHHRTADFHRHRMGFLEHAEGAAMPCAALDHVDGRVGNEAQQFGRFGAHILRPRMTGHMHGDSFGSGVSPSGRPWRLEMSMTYSSMSKVAFDSRFTFSLSGRISGHSNFSISPQDIPGWLHFHCTANEGAVFGIGQGNRWLFVIVSVLAIAFLTYLFATSGRQRFYQVVLGMLLAGVLGNMYDRIFHGFVRDMIWIFPQKRWPAWLTRAPAGVGLGQTTRSSPGSSTSPTRCSAPAWC